MNTLIGRNASEKLKIANDIPVPQIEDLEKAKNKALSNNASILLSQVSLELAKENSEIVNAQQWPQVNLNASYGINSSQNGAGIILSQKTLGLNSGISFSMPIFNGNQLTTAIKNADLATENGQLELKKAIQNIDYQFEAAKVDLQLLQDNISALEKSIALANLALERATISYNEGIISYNDLRVAQLNLLAAKSKRNEATIAMVRLFYSINRLSGDLIQK
jgi:outer membrane protein TolC